jgi:hypothetical protein
MVGDAALMSAANAWAEEFSGYTKQKPTATLPLTAVAWAKVPPRVPRSIMGTAAAAVVAVAPMVPTAVAANNGRVLSSTMPRRHEKILASGWVLRATRLDAWCWWSRLSAVNIALTPLNEVAI